MNEKLDLEKQTFRQELDEMKVQLALGRADALDYLEEKRSDFAHFIDEVKTNVSKLDSPAVESTKRVKEKLDHLKVQLALGRMETHDAYSSQRSKIVGAIDGVHEDFKTLAKGGQSEVQHLWTSFADHAKLFRTKLESAALSLGAGVLLATHEIEDTAEKVDSWLGNLANMTQDEIKGAREYVARRVATHSKKENS